MNIKIWILFAAGTLCAAPVTPTTTLSSDVFQRKSGVWENEKNWSLKTLPMAKNSAVVYDAVVSISSPVPAIGQLNVGGKTVGKVTLLPHGVLEVRGRCFIGRKRANMLGELIIEGGILRVNPEGRDETSKLYIGECATYASTARVAIESGRIQGGICIGSTLPKTGVGTLSVIGSAPVIEGKCSQDLVQCYYGTLEFVCDADGVAALHYPDSNAHFKQGSVIRIRGENYKGKTKTIPLIICRKFFEDGLRIEIEGFSPNYRAECERSRNGLLLKIQTR